MRLTIVGLPASGKSTFAGLVSEKLSIPHIHIDRFWLEAGGRRNSKETPNIEQVRAHVREKVLDAVGAASWVSDGFYQRVQSEIAQRADSVVFLDLPLWKRLLNHAQRVISADRHKEISFWDDLVFFGEIVRRSFTTTPKLRKFLNEYKDKVIVLHSRRDIKKYIENL